MCIGALPANSFSVWSHSFALPPILETKIAILCWGLCDGAKTALQSASRGLEHQALYQSALVLPHKKKLLRDLPKKMWKNHGETLGK
jgi:hypothetical protein